MVLVFVGDDLSGERGGAERARDAGKRSRRDDGRLGSVALEAKFFADRATPDHLCFDHVEFVMIFLADLFIVIGIGGDDIRNDFFFDDDFEVFWKAISLGAAERASLRNREKG